MVMLVKAVVPFSPVTVKASVVVLADWLVSIVIWDICELAMFPLIMRLTVEPLFVVACIFVEVGLGLGGVEGKCEGGKEEAGMWSPNERFNQ
jgi:hypothetical protein